MVLMLDAQYVATITACCGNQIPPPSTFQWGALKSRAANARFTVEPWLGLDYLYKYRDEREKGRPISVVVVVVMVGGRNVQPFRLVTGVIMHT